MGQTPALGCQALEKDWLRSRTWLQNYCQLFENPMAPGWGRFERSRLLSLALHHSSHLPRLVFLRFEAGLALAVESSYLPIGAK